jgi:hypothetical protein
LVWQALKTHALQLAVHSLYRLQVDRQGLPFLAPFQCYVRLPLGDQAKLIAVKMLAASAALL